VLVEYARNVLRIDGADHEETNPDGGQLVVTALSCSLVGQAEPVTVLPATRAAALYGSGEVVEDFYCNYGLNPHYRPAFDRAGLRVSGVGADDEVRIVELPQHPFFLATLFCFQTRSTDRTHPLVAGFVDAARAVPRAGIEPATPALGEPRSIL
jgi:CTP synthase (UTP-ammonia lyase)